MFTLVNRLLCYIYLQTVVWQSIACGIPKQQVLAQCVEQCLLHCAGPARQTSDPANRDLLGSVSRGECPHELEPADRRTKVVVNLARSAQEYQEPEKPRYTAFTGTGRTLTGAPANVSSHVPMCVVKTRKVCS